MENDNKPSIIKEALLEFSEIQKAAVANAKKTLAEQYPDKFNDLLKEEINKNKKSYKKIDENKESVMKDQKKEASKAVKGSVGKDGVYTEKPKMPDMVKEEREKDFMGDIENDTPNKADKKTEKGNTFVDKITTKKETPANKATIKEEFNLSELDEETIGAALENADEDDEIITLDDIESEINGMEGGEEEEIYEGKPTGQKGDAYSQLVNMRKQLDEMIGGYGEEEQEGQDELPMGSVESNLDGEITDADVEAVLGSSLGGDEFGDDEIDEAHGVTYSSRRNTVGRHTPNPQNLSKGELDQSPEYVRESKKKISSLIKENKSLTKKLNETKKYKQNVTTLVEEYKSALGKYRNQLKEMATFNTNLAHVNNLLVNESLTLTQEDKIKIINEFRKIDTITESQSKYNTLLTEMKKSKPTLTETIEKKVNASVAPSSKQKLDEVKEVTAYKNNAHINKMKKLIEYVENRGSNKII